MQANASIETQPDLRREVDDTYLEGSEHIPAYSA